VPGIDVVGPPAVPRPDAPTVAVVVEPARQRVTRELLGEAVQLARRIEGVVTAIGPELPEEKALASWGADKVVRLEGTQVEEDVAGALVSWCKSVLPWGVLAPGTLWGREVAARAAARLEAGLTGDAVGFGVRDGRLVSWKPAFGGRLVAAITATSAVQMATVRPGVLELRVARAVASQIPVEVLGREPRGRVSVLSTERHEEVEGLLSARAVVAVGAGVDPQEYSSLDGLLKVLDAELAATRKVTDKGWMPRARQVGITGHSVDPAIYVAIGTSGKFNHMVGSRSAGTVLAINNDRDAPVFEWSDVGIVADWHEVVPLLVRALD
jgi:electron transfer flavoprotein alpha subunit